MKSYSIIVATINCFSNKKEFEEYLDYILKYESIDE